MPLLQLDGQESSPWDENIGYQPPIYVPDYGSPIEVPDIPVFELPIEVPPAYYEPPVEVPQYPVYEPPVEQPQIPVFELPIEVPPVEVPQYPVYEPPIELPQLPVFEAPVDNPPVEYYPPVEVPIYVPPVELPVNNPNWPPQNEPVTVPDVPPIIDPIGTPNPVNGGGVVIDTSNLTTDDGSPITPPGGKPIDGGGMIKDNPTVVEPQKISFTWVYVLILAMAPIAYLLVKFKKNR